MSLRIHDKNTFSIACIFTFWVKVFDVNWSVNLWFFINDVTTRGTYYSYIDDSKILAEYLPLNTTVFDFKFFVRYNEQV